MCSEDSPQLVLAKVPVGNERGGSVTTERGNPTDKLERHVAPELAPCRQEMWEGFLG